MNSPFGESFRIAHIHATGLSAPSMDDAVQCNAVFATATDNVYQCVWKIIDRGTPQRIEGSISAHLSVPVTSRWQVSVSDAADGRASLNNASTSQEVLTLEEPSALRKVSKVKGHTITWLTWTRVSWRTRRAVPCPWWCGCRTCSSSISPTS